MIKPEYRVPSMAEIRKIKPNGLTWIETFSGGGGSSLGARMAGFRVLWANEFVPVAGESYRANMSPHTVFDGRDIKAVKAEEILAATGIKAGELDVFSGSPPCFNSAASIMPKAGPKPIADIKIGDVVLTHKLRWRRVLKTFQKRAPTIVLKGQGHPGLVTTAEHPFWARRMGRRWNQSDRTYDRIFSEPEWVEASALKPDGKSHHEGGKAWFWSSPARFPHSVIPTVPVQNSRSHKFDVTSPAFMHFIGAWLGDGWLRTGKTNDGRGLRGEVLLCCAKAEATETEARLKDAGFRFSRSEERTTARFLIASKPLAAWLEKHFGRYSGGKKLPGWVFGMPEASRVALLEGYQSADGYAAVQSKGGGKVRRFTTVNKELAVGFRILAGTLGFTSSIVWSDMSPTTVIEGRTVNQRGFYQLTLYERSRSAFFDLGMAWGKVRSVCETGIEEDVFNFEVEEDNSYVVDGIIVHNCQAFSTAGKREDGWGTDKVYEHGASQKNEELFFEYIRLRDGLQPKVFVAENVSGLVKGTAKGFFLEILKELKRGYRVVAPLLDAQWLGVPQARQRIVFIGVREDLGVDPPVPIPLQYRYSIREACPWIDKVVHDTMGSFKSGGTITDRPSVTIMSSPRDATHFKVQIRQNSNATHSRKGEARSLDAPAPTLLARRSNIDLETTPEPETDISRYEIGKEWDKLNPGQQSERYFGLKRADADKPCPTITAAGGEHQGIASITHPTEKRKFSILEVKRLSSFPDDYVLKGSYGAQWERLGNSVPPLMMKAVAVEIRDRVLLPARDGAKNGAPRRRSSVRSKNAKPPKGAGRTPA